MRLHRFWVVGFVLIFVLLLLSMSMGSQVQAENLLQDVPRLDGVNIYFTEAAGEASRFDRGVNGLSRFAGLLRQLGANLYTLEWRTTFPTDADLIVIAGPSADLSPDQTARLWSYVNNGGKLLLFANTTVEARRAFPAAGGLFALMWTDMGIRALDDVVAEEAGFETIYATVTAEAPEATEVVQPESVEERTPQPTATLAPTSTPQLIEIGQRAILNSVFMTSNLNEHPITDGVEGPLSFWTARSIEADSGIQGFEVTPLVYTDGNYYGESDWGTYLSTGTYDFNIGLDTAEGQLLLAAAYNNERTGTRLVVVGDREFVSNGAGFKTSPPNSSAFVTPSNVRFALNAVTWLLSVDRADFTFPSPAPTATVTMTASPTPTRTPSS
jgi:hypothetical protein